MRILKTVFLTALLALTIVSCKKVSEPFFFIQLADPQMGFKEHGQIERSVRLLGEAVDAINRLEPAFVLVTGDMVSHWNDSTELAAYDSLMACIKPGIKVYHVPGNHDYRPFREDGVGSDAAYLERYGYDHFDFVYDGSLFLGYNSCFIKDGDTAKEEAQYEWMVATLEKYKGKVNHIFITAHCSMILEAPDEEEQYFNFQAPYREKYLKLCRDYGVDAVFTGHYHRPRFVEHDGTQHITCTASGFPLGDGFSAINVVSVTPEAFSYEMVPALEAVAPDFK